MLRSEVAYPGCGMSPAAGSSGEATVRRGEGHSWLGNSQNPTRPGSARHSDPGGGRLRRARSISGAEAIQMLFELTGTADTRCAEAIEDVLLTKEQFGSMEDPSTYTTFRMPETKRPKRYLFQYLKSLLLLPSGWPETSVLQVLALAR